MKLNVWLSLFCVFAPYYSFAQHNKLTNDFQYLVKTICDDYPGYKVKVSPALDSLEKQIRNKIKQYPDSIFYYLNQYTAFFKDGHLRVERLGINSNIPEIDTVKVPTHHIDRNYLLRNNNPQNLEGLWKSFFDEIAILKSTTDTNSFDGIFLNHDKGFLNFTPINDTTFIFVAKGTVSRYPPKGYASLQLNQRILEIHNSNQYFTRKSNNEIYDETVLSTYLPSHPNGRNNYYMASVLDDSTFYLRIPSFNRYFKDRIEETLLKYWNDIQIRPYFIIDIRGNVGGQNSTYEALLPLLYTHPFLHKGVEWYASAGNLQDLESSLKNGEIENGEDGISWSKALISEMKHHDGDFVRHPYDQKVSDTIIYDTVYKYPRKIGIIINKLNASAAEQFLLYAKNSSKTRLFGNEKTAGILDYSNAVPRTFPSGDFELIIPMTRSLRLPDDPIDNIGISPDCNISFPASSDLFDRLDSWVYFVKNYFLIEDEKMQEETN